MLQISSAAVMSRHDATAKRGANFGNEAHSGISFQIIQGRFTRIGIAQGNSWSIPHEIDDRIVIIHCHDTDIEHGI